MKTCSKCKEVKPLSEFHKRNTSKCGYKSECKVCRNATNKQYKKDNEIKELEYRSKNRDTAKQRASSWYYANKDNIETKEKRKVYAASWRNTYPEKNNKKAADYRGRKLNATPKWLSAEQHASILREYELAAWCSKVMHIDYHVDHIVPLKGGNVCGLHVPWNLQVIPAKDNLRKNNKHEQLC